MTILPKTHFKKAAVFLLCISFLAALPMYTVNANATSGQTDFCLNFDVWQGSGTVDVILRQHNPMDNNRAVIFENFEKLTLQEADILTFQETDVDKSFYTLEKIDGKPVLTLKENYLKILTDGRHFFLAYFKNVPEPILIKLNIATKKLHLENAGFDFEMVPDADGADVTLDNNKYSVVFDISMLEKLCYNGVELKESDFEFFNRHTKLIFVLYSGVLDTLSLGEHIFHAYFMNLSEPVQLKLIKTEPYIYGDLNHDGLVTATDARICLRASAQLTSLTLRQERAANVFFNGEITAANARKILLVSSELEDFYL